MDLMNVPFVNMGVCGFGNEYIFKSVKSNLKYINKNDLIIIVFSYPYRYKKHNIYTPEELFIKFEKLLKDYRRFYFNGFYPFIENQNYKFPKHFINPKETLAYQLQIEEVINKKNVWEYDSKSVWNDEKNYHEGDYHPNINGYQLLALIIFTNKLKIKSNAIQSNQHKNIWNENLLYLREKISTYIPNIYETDY